MSQAPGPGSPLNNKATIGPYHWPPQPDTGVVVVKVKTGITLDIQVPKGKDPARATMKGRKPADVTLELSWTRAVEMEGDAIRIALDPAGVNAGKAWDLVHVEANKRGVNAVMFDSASELTVTGDMYRTTLTGKGWTEPAKVAVGGAKTPNKSVPANEYFQAGRTLPTGEIQPQGNVALADAPRHGLDGPNKPSADP